MVEDHAGEVRAALVRARSAVDEHWRMRQEQDHLPSEDEQTVIFCSAAWPQIEYVQFNTVEEGRIGADWLWWFVDASGECFGILAQAKRLFRNRKGWSIGFEYESGGRLQMDKLLDAAERFEIPAAYILYCGDSDYRAGLRCGPSHCEPPCPTCARSGVSILAGPCAKYVVEYSKSADEAFRWSSPVEDMVASEPSCYVPDLDLRSLSDDLKLFLLTQQTGARQVAKHFFIQAADMRRGHFAPAVVEEAPARVQRVFGVTPLDQGHFGLPYFDHILRGLRRVVPDEIRSLVLDGESAESGDFPGLDGVAVVHV